MNESQKHARRRWRGDLNNIPVEIAYGFELGYIIENNAADGFRGSLARVLSAKQELVTRQLEAGERARIAEGNLWDDLRLKLRRIMREITEEARA